jgi:hypothetical protein
VIHEQCDAQEKEQVAREEKRGIDEKIDRVVREIK